MTAILLTGLAVVLCGLVVLIRTMGMGTEADRDRAQAWQDDGWHDAETLARLAQERARAEMRERIARLMREARGRR